MSSHTLRYMRAEYTFPKAKAILEDKMSNVVAGCGPNWSASARWVASNTADLP